VEVERLPTTYLRCRPCGGAVELLTRPGAEVSFPRALRGALLLPVGLPGLLLLLLLAVVAAQLTALDDPARTAALLGWSVAAWTVGVAIVRATADGAATLAGVPAEPWKDLLRPALAAAVVTTPAVFLPRTGFPEALLVLGGAILLTPLLLGVLSSEGAFRALSPVRAVRMLHRLGADGALAALCIGAVWLFAWTLVGTANAPRGEIPPLWHAGPATLAPLSLFFVPRVIGLLLEARGEDLGYRFRVRGAVPVLPGVRPEVTRVHRPPEAPPRARPEPIAVDETASGRLELEPFAPGGGEREE
jgi:hypothetical protein